MRPSDGSADLPTSGNRASDEPEAAALARLYDLDLQDDPGDLDLYLALAERQGDPILELAAGSGRIAVPLARAGHRVTGIDLDPAMLARARDRAAEAGPAAQKRLTLVEADLLDLSLDDAGSYQLAIVALNSLLVLASREAQRRALRTMATHLAPGGLAVVDAWQPDADDLARFDGRLMVEWTRVDAAAGTRVAKLGSALHDAATQTVTLTTLFEEWPPGGPVARWSRVDRMRLVSADELIGMAEDAGLEVEMVAGGYDLDPIAPGSDRAVLLATRP